MRPLHPNAVHCDTEADATCVEHAWSSTRGHAWPSLQWAPGRRLASRVEAARLAKAAQACADGSGSHMTGPWLLAIDLDSPEPRADLNPDGPEPGPCRPSAQAGPHPEPGSGIPVASAIAAGPSRRPTALTRSLAGPNFVCYWKSPRSCCSAGATGGALPAACSVRTEELEPWSHQAPRAGGTRNGRARTKGATTGQI